MKMKQNKFFFYLAIGLGLSIAVFSCKKVDEAVDNAKDKPTAVSLTVASSLSEGFYDDVFNQINLEAENNNISGREMGENGVQGCTSVTVTPVEPNTFPKTMTIDFGAGCTNGNITRKGKIIVVLSGKLRTNGTTATVSFENYYVNEHKVEGTMTITNNTANNVLKFTRQISNGKLTYPGGAIFYTYNGTHTVTLSAGSGTPTYADDSWSVTGSGTTTSSANETLTVSIKTPLVKNVACGSVVSGIEEFTYNSVSGSINFGDGTCDRKAVLTIGTFTQEFTF